MATYNRGRHILPSVHSVLRQSLQDFELLVVGDHCTDDTEAQLRPLLCQNVRWINLADHGGSQSFPNNAGITIARGEYVAYIGHDDIWAPGHLEALSRCFLTNPGLDYAVSGLMSYPQQGRDEAVVLGMFKDSVAASEHFFPPSCLSHRRDVTERVGPWASPLSVRAPVDVDLQLRAAGAQLHFASTQVVTVHKFPAASRYLSYKLQSSREQEAMLEAVAQADFPAAVFDKVLLAQATDKFMIRRIQPSADQQPGELYLKVSRKKGSRLAKVPPLVAPARIPPETGFYAGDWQNVPSKGFLWAAKNRWPKLLIPFRSTATAKLEIVVAHPLREALQNVALARPFVAKLPVERLQQVDGLWQGVITFELSLADADGTAIELDLAPDQLSRVRRGLGIGDILVVPNVATGQ